MGILDQLKQEAAVKQQQKQLHENLQHQREERYRKVILPVMQTVFGFMEELVKYLNILEDAIIVENYSDKFPQLGILTQQEYKIYTDNFGGFSDFDRLMQVNVRFICLGSGLFSYNVVGQGRIDQEISLLSASKINFDWKYQGGNAGMRSACFTFTRNIPVRFKFDVDYQNSKIRLQINNHENFMVFSKLFEPEEVNESLLDEVARFMLRKDSDFIRLELPNANRKAIQQLVDDHRLEHLAIMQEIYNEEMLRKPSGPKSLLMNFKKMGSLTGKE